MFQVKTVSELKLTADNVYPNLILIFKKYEGVVLPKILVLKP